MFEEILTSPFLLFFAAATGATGLLMLSHSRHKPTATVDVPKSQIETRELKQRQEALEDRVAATEAVVKATEAVVKDLKIVLQLKPPENKLMAKPQQEKETILEEEDQKKIEQLPATTSTQPPKPVHDARSKTPKKKPLKPQAEEGTEVSIVGQS